MDENKKKVYTEAEINQHASFYDAEIIPNVYYQVYGFDKVYCHDDEGMDYEFNETPGSTIKIQVVTETTKTYYQVGALTLGDDESEALNEIPTGAKKFGEGSAYPTDAELITDGAKVGDVYYTIIEGTSATYKTKTVTASFSDTTLDINTEAGYETIRTHLVGETASDSTVPAGAKKDDVYYTITETLVPDPATATEPYEYNKYGDIKLNSKVYATVTLSSDLLSEYPTVTINVDGKDYGKFTDKTFTFYMDKDHKIQINWVYGKIVETFRITCNR
jgi:hypothetical protein